MKWLLVPASWVCVAALRTGDINIVVTTDVHSWLASHPHPDHTPTIDAGFGSIASFVSHLRASTLGDVFFFDNGDVVDGTGLPSASVFSLLSLMPYDALNCGNHELYHSETVVEGLVPFVRHWKGRYLTSNVELADGTLLGARFAVLRGARGRTVLALGFLFEMDDHCAAVRVARFEEALTSAWFAEATRAAQNADAIVVLAHMHYADPLVAQLLAAIRAKLPTKPVQFLTGHSHVRAWTRLDDHAANFEAGHYADTLGFASFNVSQSDSAVEFEHVPLDMTLAALAAAVGISPADLETAEGAAIDAAVARERARLGVDALLGRVATTYWVEAALDAADSLWALYLNHVAPDFVLSPPRTAQQAFLTSSGALRYDLYAGNVTRNDIDTILPFADALWIARGLNASVLASALAALNAATLERSATPPEASRRPLRALSAHLPAYLSTSLAAATDAIFGDFDKPRVSAALEAAAGRAIQVSAYAAGSNTTTDTGAWVRWAQALPPQYPHL